MRRLSGPLLMATGVLDLLYVLVFHSRQLAAIAGDGFFGAVEIDPSQLDRETAFWRSGLRAYWMCFGTVSMCWNQTTATDEGGMRVYGQGNF